MDTTLKVLIIMLVVSQVAILIFLQSNDQKFHKIFYSMRAELVRLGAIIDQKDIEIKKLKRKTMIINFDQYQRTKHWINQFTQRGKDLALTPPDHPDRANIDPLAWQAMIDANQSIVDDLQNQLLEYDLTQTT